MVKFAALATAFLAGSVSAFAPAKSTSNRNIALSAEKSQALPFMNRPALVSKSTAMEEMFLESPMSSNAVTSSVLSHDCIFVLSFQ